jgi:hypothetical protein
VELCLHSPNTPSWRGAQLKHRDNFTFTFMGSLSPRNSAPGVVDGGDGLHIRRVDVRFQLVDSGQKH